MKEHSVKNNPQPHGAATRRRGVFACIVAIGLSAPLLNVATADAVGAVQVKPTVTIDGYDGRDYDRVVFWGKVMAAKPLKRCRKQRSVTLWQASDKVTAGRAKTDRSGRWRIAFDGDEIAPGKFRVKVTRKVIRVKGHKVVCKGARTSYVMDDLRAVA